VEKENPRNNEKQGKPRNNEKLENPKNKEKQENIENKLCVTDIFSVKLNL
jgi:hypothetical protein